MRHHREAKVVADVLAGEPAAFDNVAIPAVVFTDPEIAEVGVAEAEAFAAGRKLRVTKVPFSASLFTGSPPPQTLKYSQASRHIATPA